LHHAATGPQKLARASLVRWFADQLRNGIFCGSFELDRFDDACDQVSPAGVGRKVVDELVNASLKLCLNGVPT
jgi:hypothetical protein